jgi:tRNA1Val (adenine37-N6)-methyltransferase
MPHNNYFEFKQFTVWQNHAAMRVGTDGVLLGTWASVEGMKNILDIGTGTGMISLMLAQRCKAIIHAIDIEEGAVTDATHNFDRSPWKDRLTVYPSGLSNYAQGCPTKYDGIVCNPPFFINSKKPDCKIRELARHTSSLSFSELVINAAKLLNPNGRFSVVLPIESEQQFRVEASHARLFPVRICRVQANPLKPFKRVLMELAFEAGLLTETTLTIETGQRHIYTPDFKCLVKDFYLKV